MILYTIIWFVLLFLSLSKPRSSFLYYAIITFLVCFAGFRDFSVGTDTPAYHRIFEWISEGSAKYIEPGWWFLNKLVSIEGGNFTTVLILASILTFIPLIYLSSHYKSYRYEILFFYYSMFFYLNTFNGMRQYIAVSIGLVTFELIRIKEKKWKVLLSIAIAVLFHYSSVFLLVALFVNKISLKEGWCISVLLISFIIGTFADVSFFDFFAGGYAKYLYRDEFGFRESTASIYILTIIMNCLFLWLLIYKGKLYDVFWMKLFFIGIILLNLTFRIGLGARLILFYTITQIIVFPLFLYKNRINNQPLVYLFVLLYFSLLFFRNFIGDATGGDIVPYKSVFNFSL